MGRHLSLVLVALVCLTNTSWAEPDRHVRVATRNGPVHVWIPANADLATAGLVIYVHGFYTHVDRAWREHRLAAQFADSGLNAVFVACGAPSGVREPVRWTSLPALLRVVDRVVGQRPPGRVVAVGHSAAHRTLLWWLGDELDEIVLVDALYAGLHAFRRWVSADPDRRLVDLGVETQRWTELLHEQLPETVVYDELELDAGGELPGAADARIVYVRSRIDHFELVTEGLVLPALLRATRLPRVAAPEP